MDAHVHLPEYGNPAMVAAGPAARCLFSCTVNQAQVEVNQALRENSKGRVRSFLGVHPSDVTETPPSRWLTPWVEGCDGIGEIGLDPKYSAVGEGSSQMRAFLDQLSLAERFRKPVQIHSRNSEKVCLDVLGTFNLPSVLMHWFQGEEAEVQRATSRGYYFSFGPALLYSKRVGRIAERVPLDRLLTESDGPVPFAPLEGASGPNLIASVLFRLGEMRGLSFGEAERTIETNAQRYLGAERLM